MYCVPEKEISRLAYNDQFSSIKHAHPEWSLHEVRLQTAVTVRPQFQLDRETVEKENLGLSDYEVPQAAFTVTDGTVFYTNYQRGLLELHERQKRLTPERYSSQEHAISLLIEEQFKRGSTSVVTSYGDRDVVIMRYDHATKKGTTEIINTAVFKENKKQTIHEFIHQQFPKLESLFVATGVFLFADKAMSLKEAKKHVQFLLKESMVKKENYATKRQYKKAHNHQQENIGIPLPLLKNAMFFDETHRVSPLPLVRKQQVFINKNEILKAKKGTQKKENTINGEKTAKKQFPERAPSFSSALVHEHSKETQEQQEKQMPQKSKIEGVMDTDIFEKLLGEKKEGVIFQRKQPAQEVVHGEVKKMKAPQSIKETYLFVDKDMAIKEEGKANGADSVDTPYDQQAFEDVVLEQSLEEYFEKNDTQETIVHVEPSIINLLCLPHKQEEDFEIKLPFGISKKIQKLCWLSPLKNIGESPELWEIDIPKDRNQRLYNLLHFLKKVVKQLVGDDVIRTRHIQQVRADERSFVDEIKYYLSVLEQKSSYGRMFAVIN